MTSWLALGVALAQTVNPDAIAHKAVDDFRAGKYADASNELRSALRYLPSSAALWAYLGLAEGSLNHTGDAITAFEKARSLSPRDPQILFNLGALYARTNHARQASEMYAQGLAVQPDDVSANQNFALLLMQAGQYDRALMPLRTLRSLRPEQLPVRVSLIECDLKAGYVEEAQQEISSFLALPGLTDSDRMKAAQLFVEQHVSQAAETVLRDTVLRYDNSAEAHAGLGKLLLERKRHEDAVRELGRAAQLAPDAPGYSLGLAEALLDWRHFGPAYEFLKAVQPKFGTLPDFKYKMGLALFGLNLFPQAIPQFQALVRERPKADSGWFSLGNSWAAMGKLNDAETCYRRAIALNDRNGGYYAALGQVLRHSDEDRTAEAINAFKEAVRLDPSDAQSRVELAICYERGRRFTEAQELLERAILQRPDLTQAHVALARVYYKLHRTADGDRERKMAAQLQGKEQNKQAAQSDQAKPEPLR